MITARAAGARVVVTVPVAPAFVDVIHAVAAAHVDLTDRPTLHDALDDVGTALAEIGGACPPVGPAAREWHERRLSVGMDVLAELLGEPQAGSVSLTIADAEALALALITAAREAGAASVTAAERLRAAA